MPSRSRAFTYTRQYLLRSNQSTFLVLLFFFLYTSWLYTSLKRRADIERHSPTQLHSTGPKFAVSESMPVDASGHLVGSQLTHAVAASALVSWGLDDSYRLGRIAGESSVPEPTLPHLQVVSAAASRHSLFVTTAGATYSMGPNNSAGGGGHGSKPLEASGQLGRPGSSAPAPLAAGPLAGQLVVQVATGRYHSVAVTADGSVFTWGLNDWGQLGRQVQQESQLTDAAGSPGNSSAAAQHHLLRKLHEGDDAAGSDATTSGSQSSSTDSTTGADSGSSMCSYGWSCRAALPGRVDAATDNMRIVAAAAGRYSTLLLDDAGHLWVFGYDGCAEGQLPQQQDAWRARQVVGELAGKMVVAFDIGYTFWLAATSDGQVFTCDHMDDGYAGTLPQKRQPNHAGQLGRPGPTNQPGRVDALSSHKVLAVAAGREHALVVTAEGEVFSWGGGEAVLGRQGPRGLPGLVTGTLDGEFVRHVAAGEYFSLAATDSKVFAWGSNAYRCLGSSNSSIKESREPMVVAGPLGSGDWLIRGIVAGYQHAFALADNPGDSELARLRQGASIAPVVAAVEVVLTEQQQQERQKQHRSQPTQQLAGKREEPPSSTNTSQPLLTPAGQARTVNAAAGSTAAWHTSYLPAHFANLALPHESWAAWSPSPWQKQLQALSGDVFKLLPKEYNSMHKNPCWGGVGPQLACLPYFNIIGVSKCGTTDLYHRLTMHKQILPATNKGPHFWDECPYPANGSCSAGPSGDFQAYVNLFNRAADLVRSRPDAVTGEASSNTFTSANGVYLRGFKGDKPWAGWAGAAGTNASMPALLREAQPYLRLIVMFRNPVDRYYSAYHYYRWWMSDQTPPTPDEFHSHAVEEMQQWQACVAEAGTANCLRRYTPQQLVKGMYSEFFQDWLRHFPREQLLILRYEDYKAALAEHLKTVLRFLDVEQPDAAVWAAMTGASVQNKKEYPSMCADTRKLLEQFYAPFNQALLQALAGDQRWLWQDHEQLAGTNQDA